MKTLFIWIIIAGVLGAAVLTIRARQASAHLNGPLTTSRTLGIDPAEITGLEIIAAAATNRQILERDPEHPDQWFIHWSNDGMDHAWLASSPKARSGVRVLATTRIDLIEDDLVIKAAGEVIIRRQSGYLTRIEFDENSSGGHHLVRVEERDNEGVAIERWFGKVDKSVFDTFISKGMLHWRSKRLFDMSNSAIRQVELQAMGSEVHLNQSTSGWNIESPIQANGNRDKIEELVKIIISLESKTFVDTSIDSQTSGLTNPIATVALSTKDQTATLTIGTRADVNGSTVYAQIESPTGSALITLETDQLSKLTAAVEAYISKTPSRTSPRSIAAVRMIGRDGKERLIAERSADKWMIDSKQADSINRDAIERLVRVLTRDEASFVQLLDTASLPPLTGYVDLLSEDSTVLNHFGIAIDSTEAGMRLLIIQELSNDQHLIWGTSTENAIATGAWFTAVAGKRVP